MQFLNDKWHKTLKKKAKAIHADIVIFVQLLISTVKNQ